MYHYDWCTVLFSMLGQYSIVLFVPFSISSIGNTKASRLLLLVFSLGDSTTLGKEEDSENTCYHNTLEKN